MSTAAFFSASGFYTVTNMEMPAGFDVEIDVVGMKPILKEIKARSKKGPAPAGVLHLLSTDKWVLTEDIIEAVGGEPAFSKGVLMECEGKGWVEKHIEAEDVVYWRLKDYNIPAREVFLALSGDKEPITSLKTLKKTRQTCNRSYLILSYEVDNDFVQECFYAGIGILLFYPRNGYFREILPSEYQDIHDKRSQLVLCERVLFENYVLRMEDIV
ncbi:hypothetical protein [Natranaerofaba carboxydovora]|uniref:hypothetical protein n=1 Tax=Natranaerofaba carboxydovora TaxID=2742683 RepID=UPI001F132741|nr:hypothetical protein [Natranaerofaba carboxydovora]UMZ74237.1 hypothetical protein ACONDI_01823 [Natranaerofaba carboxydovora]